MIYDSIRFFEKRVDDIVAVLFKEYRDVRVTYRPLTDRITITAKPPGLFGYTTALSGTWDKQEIQKIGDDFTRAHMRELLNRSRELHEIELIRGEH